jgi:hypothetical protein
MEEDAAIPEELHDRKRKQENDKETNCEESSAAFGSFMADYALEAEEMTKYLRFMGSTIDLGLVRFSC